MVRAIVIDIFLFSLHFFGDSQAHFPANLFGCMRGTIAHKIRLINIAMYADAICYQVDM
ncbi:hypothetical protein FACS189426_12610 [Bacteroidia bacterium]|nr:hypothetical protein FACS189426_12610 [Bacteroidia bacterium]